MTTKLTVLISGSGTNLQALIDACADGRLPCQIICVLSNRKDAYGLERAKKASIPTKYHNLVKYKKLHPHSDPDVKDASDEARQAYDADLAKHVLDDKPDMVVCAGWMHILKPEFLDPLKNAGVPVINLHPALYDQFNGANAIGRAYQAFQDGKIKHTGCMIHYVIAEVDKGAEICHDEVVIKPDDTGHDLEERMHQHEHKLIVKGTKIATEHLQQKHNE